MLGHGVPWGHAEMCHRAGMPREDGWIDVRVGGQAGLLAGSTAERAEPLGEAGSTGRGGAGGLRLPRTLDKTSPPNLCPGVTVLVRWLSAAQCGTPSTSPYMAAMIWVTI